MAEKTHIQWTQATWNPVTGCDKISSGCKFCYAERLALRLKRMHNPRYQNGFKVTLHEAQLALPNKWKTPKLIFVNSMSDLFHKDVPDDFIQKVFETMGAAQLHTFQVLTKRSARLAQLAPKLVWPQNVWMGVSVEDNNALARVEHLRQVPASVRFLSCEPLIGPLSDLNLTVIDWVIVGGESGPGARPMNPQWVHEIHTKCQETRTPFFFKQWGGVRKELTGRLLNGREYDEMPKLKE